MSIFKPTGFEDAWVAFADDRGAAARAALDRYDVKMLRCLNHVACTLRDDEWAHEQIASKRAVLLEV